MWQEVVGIIIGLLCGSIMFGSIISTVLYKTNIRKHGSNNPGSTNVGRVLGKTAGLLTFILDAAKGALPVGILIVLRQQTIEFSSVHVFVGGLGAVIGHCFSPWVKFKGGKGVATSIGALLVISPFFFPILAVTWLGALFLTSFSSVGGIMFAATSLIVGLAIPSILQENIVYMNQGWVWSQTNYYIIICVLIGVTLLVIIRHHENISRLYHGTEKQVNWKNFVKRTFKKSK